MRPRGIPRGRHAPSRHTGMQCVLASMRPRVFPAEDDDGNMSLYAHIPRASMRPRVFPAEDVSSSFPLLSVSVASMRPRVFPAGRRQ